MRVVSARADEIETLDVVPTEDGILLRMALSDWRRPMRSGSGGATSPGPAAAACAVWKALPRPCADRAG